MPLSKEYRFSPKELSLIRYIRKVKYRLRIIFIEIMSRIGNGLRSYIYNR